MTELQDIAAGIRDIATGLLDAAGLVLACLASRVAALFAQDGRFRRYLERGGPFFRGGV